MLTHSILPLIISNGVFIAVSVGIINDNIIWINCGYTAPGLALASTKYSGIATKISVFWNQKVKVTIIWHNIKYNHTPRKK